MGADMNGYFLAVPDGYEKTVNKRLAEIDKALKIAKDPGSLDGPKTMYKAVKALQDLGLDFASAYPDLENDGLGKDNESLLASVMGDYEVAKKFTLKDFNYRDLASVTQRINGKKVSLIFAGDMSWGDEPAGGGYAVMKSLYNLGIGAALWRSVMRRAEAQVKTLKGTLTVNASGEGTRFFSADGVAGEILIDAFDVHVLRAELVESKFMRGIKTGEVLDVTITVKRRVK